MKVVVLHNEVSPESPVDSADVLVQRDAVAHALGELGHDVVALAASLDLNHIALSLHAMKPDLVFNLVESLNGTDRWIAMAPLLLDGLNIPYTGSPTRALLATTDKLYAKQMLLEHQLPTPPWITSERRNWYGLSHDAAAWRPSNAIIKSVWEHASFGLDDAAVVDVDWTTENGRIWQEIVEREQRTGRPHFAECYIDGREFNLSLLASHDGPLVLPPAEIDFSRFPAGKPRIVGYQAKWDVGTFEYDNTPRTFDYPTSDEPLIDELSCLARRCWSVFGLRGYARVDFRIDEHGRPWILEINANPCLSPDAGFAAALEQRDVRFLDAIEAVIDDTLKGDEWKLQATK